MNNPSKNIDLLTSFDNTNEVSIINNNEMNNDENNNDKVNNDKVNKKDDKKISQIISNKTENNIKQKKPERNEHCLCGSKKKFKKCCMIKYEIFEMDLKYEKEHLTDKFNILWCCNSFFRAYTINWKIKILHFESHGKRYFTRIEFENQDLVRAFSNKYYTHQRYVIHKDNKKHFGYMLRDNAPLCRSMFSKNIRLSPNSEHICSDKCNNPNMELDEHAIYETICENCQDTPCDDLLSTFNELMISLQQKNKKIK